MAAADDRPRIERERSTSVAEQLQQQEKDRPRLITERSVTRLSPPRVLARKPSVTNVGVTRSESSQFNRVASGVSVTRVHTLRSNLVHSASRFFGRKPGFENQRVINGTEQENPWGVTPRCSRGGDGGIGANDEDERDGDGEVDEPPNVVQVISTASIVAPGDSSTQLSARARSKFRGLLSSTFGGKQQESAVRNEQASGLPVESSAEETESTAAIEATGDAAAGAGASSDVGTKATATAGGDAGPTTNAHGNAALSGSCGTSSSSEVLVVVTEDVPTEQYEDDFVNFSTARRKPKEKFRDAVRRLMLGQPPKLRET